MPRHQRQCEFIYRRRRQAVQCTNAVPNRSHLPLCSIHRNRGHLRLIEQRTLSLI